MPAGYSRPGDGNAAKKGGALGPPGNNRGETYFRSTIFRVLTKSPAVTL